MRTTGPLLAATLCAALALPAPAASETPKPAGAAEETEVRLVLIDTVVTDKDGNPMPGLSLSDFTLKVDGKKAPIDALENRCSGEPAEAATPSPASRPAGAVPSPAGQETQAAAPVRPPAAKVVLYFDLPHLSPPSALRSVSAARRFLGTDAATGGGSVEYMVIAYGPRVRILSSFTSDKARILSALNQVMAHGVTYDEGPLARTQNLVDVARETCPGDTQGAVGRESKPHSQTCPSQVSMARRYAQVAEQSARRSLEALTQTMISLSGSSDERKTLILFSETLEREPGVEYLQLARRTPAGEQISVDLEWSRLIAEANAARVSFYPVYAPGLGEASDSEIAASTTSMGTASQVFLGQTGAHSPKGNLPTSAGVMAVQTGPVAEAARAAEGAALDFNASVAASTGGRHLGRTNALDLVFNLVAQDRACVYVLAYKPGPEQPGKSHAIQVSVDEKRARVRSRESYVDWSPDERAERRIGVALAAPGAFNAFDMDLAAFPLGEIGGRTQVLVSLLIPAGALARSATGLAGPDRAAAVTVRGRVSSKEKRVCTFDDSFDVPRVPDGEPIRRIQFEAACALPPGRYELVAAAIEDLGGDLSAIRHEIYVPNLATLYVGDAQLWVASSGDLVERSEAKAIFGPSAGLARDVAVPRAERRLAPGESGGLLTLVCPGTDGSKLLPVTLTRVLLSGEEPVATFPPLQLAEMPGASTGCWGVTSPLPKGVLGPGVYNFDYQILSAALAEPMGGRASFAVGEPPAEP